MRANLPDSISIIYLDDSEGGITKYKDVPGRILPGGIFALTAYNRYALTHIKTGRMVVKVSTLKGAKGLSDALQKLPINWDYSDWSEWKKWPKDVFEKVQALAMEYQYK